MTSNYDVALKAEAKKVIRCFQHYSVDQITTLASGRGNRTKLVNRGEFFYVHPDCPGIAFRRRIDAARRALS